MTMTPKIQDALRLADAAGISRRDSTPPLHRLLWRAGIPVVPPHFASFWFNAALMGTFFGVIMGVFIDLYARHLGRHSTALQGVVGALVLGLLFGLTMAAVVRRRARNARLPAWASV